MLKEFLRYLQYEKNYSTHTVLSYNIDLKQFQIFYEKLTGTYNIEKAETSDIRQWIVSITKDHKISPNTISRKLSTLRIFYKFLLKKGIIEVSPIKNISAPKRTRPIPAFMTESEMNKINEENVLTDIISDSNFFINSRDNLIIETLYQTGIRRTELINIKHSDIDTERKTIKIHGKRRKIRYVPFGDALEKMLLEYTKIKNEYILPQNDFLFVLKNGRCMYEKAVYNIVVKKLAPLTTNEKHSPHTLRHTFATVLLNNGADLNAVKELLGHSSLTSTQIYTHTTFKELQEAYKNAHPRAE